MSNDMTDVSQAVDETGGIWNNWRQWMKDAPRDRTLWRRMGFVWSCGWGSLDPDVIASKMIESHSQLLTDSQNSPTPHES